MLFNSLTFVVFFVIVFAIDRLPLSWRIRKFNLLIASYLFYAAWNPPFVILLWISTIVDWLVAFAMYAAKTPRKRRALLLISLIANLGLLGFFKYGKFLLTNFVAMLSAVGVQYSPPAIDIILPVGISFYTFQTLSYTIDVYRGELKPARSLLDFALFVTFFPQLVAGPIVRASDFLPQLVEPKRANEKQIVFGIFLMLLGLFEKVILANSVLAPVADKVFQSAVYYGGVDAWVGVLAFSGQIFCDFAGYSTCAIGAALCFGFVLTDNFHFPYAAIGFSDFWRRWHISLSTWLRDYLYIPLGGNRKGTTRTQVNLMLTMLLGGLWHGAAWKFVIWGGLHGAFLAIERGAKSLFGEWQMFQWWAMRVALALLTYTMVLITWVFFRAINLQYAYAQILAMFTGNSYFPTPDPKAYRLSLNEYGWVLGVSAALLLTHGLMRNTNVETVMGKVYWPIRGVIMAALAITLILAPGDDRAFIYFQF